MSSYLSQVLPNALGHHHCLLGRGQEDTPICEVTPEQKSFTWFPLQTFLKVLLFKKRLHSSLLTWAVRDIPFRSDQSLSRVRLFATPWIAARQASLSITNSLREVTQLNSNSDGAVRGHWVTLSYALHCLDALRQATGLSRLQPPGW